MYQVRLLDAAAQELAKLDKPVARRIAKRLTWLAGNAAHIKHLPLTGNLAGCYKLRIGDYRVLYEVLHDEDVILIHLIGHRREVYR